MPDPWGKQKRAFHYALEGDTFLCKNSLRELDSDELQDIVLAAGLLKIWAMDVFFEDETSIIKKLRSDT